MFSPGEILNFLWLWNEGRKKELDTIDEEQCEDTKLSP